MADASEAVLPECIECSGTGVVVELAGDEQATRLGGIYRRLGEQSPVFRTMGISGPGVRVALCKCVVRRLNRALTLDDIRVQRG